MNPTTHIKYEIKIDKIGVYRLVSSNKERTYLHAVVRIEEIDGYRVMIDELSRKRVIGIERPGEEAAESRVASYIRDLKHKLEAL